VAQVDSGDSVTENSEEQEKGISPIIDRPEKGDILEWHQITRNLLHTNNEALLS
jgi:hypothetical protein